MAALADAMKKGIWFDRSKVEDAEYKYQAYLVRGSVVKETKKAGEGSVSQQIAEARQKIQASLKDSSSTASGDTNSDMLQRQVEELRKLVGDMTQQFQKLESRLGALEAQAGTTTQATKTTTNVTNGVAAEDDDDSDLDLFGSEDEEDTAEAERIKSERVAAYEARKAKKAPVTAKSGILLDVKPWDDETDMKEVERLVRTIEADGLKWGGSQLVKVAFGIKKLQINCVVEDDKVGTDFLEEEIMKFEDHVQSIDIAAFNKI